MRARWEEAVKAHPRFDPIKQAWLHDPNWEPDEEYPDLLPPTHKPMKTRLNVRKVLAVWEKDAVKYAKQRLESLDVEGEIMERQTLMSIRTIQSQIEFENVDHVLGLALFPRGKFLTRDNVQALASVSLEPWPYVNGRIRQEQGADVSVVHISELVASPAYPLQVWGVEIVHGIVAWANEMGKLVTIMPANKILEEYYKSLGFRRIDENAFTMVYRGKPEQDPPRRGLLVDTSLNL